MGKIKYIRGKETSEYWEVIEEQKCKVLNHYWYNGEGWYNLETEDGERIESPDIFWEEIK